MLNFSKKKNTLKFLLSYLIFFNILFSSCNNPINPLLKDKSDKEKIIGKWGILNSDLSYGGVVGYTFYKDKTFIITIKTVEGYIYDSNGNYSLSSRFDEKVLKIKRQVPQGYFVTDVFKIVKLSDDSLIISDGIQTQTLNKIK